MDLTRCWHCAGKIKKIDPSSPQVNDVDYWCLRCGRGWKWVDARKQWYSRATSNLERYDPAGNRMRPTTVDVKHKDGICTVIDCEEMGSTRVVIESNGLFFIECFCDAHENKWRGGAK